MLFTNSLFFVSKRYKPGELVGMKLPSQKVFFVKFCQESMCMYWLMNSGEEEERL